MELQELTLAVYEAGEIRAGLRVVTDALSRGGTGGAAVWIPEDPADPTVAEPAGRAVQPPLLDLARARAGEGVRSLAGAEDLPGSPDVLVIPLGDPPGTVALQAEPGSFAGDPAGWDRLARAIGALANGARGRTAAAARQRIQRLELDQYELRRRVEESEALHTLGLAANRSLDPDEVLELVTRLTRTALGASYVTVSTTEPAVVRTAAAVGLHAPPPETDPFATEIVTAARTLRVGTGEALRPEDFPPHAEEGMLAGLGVPLSLYGEIIGALVIGYRRPIELTPRHVRLALTLAGHGAVAISNARLHRALATRTAEAERAYQELRWSAETKERFFAALSHELRTPLNAILGYHSLILEGVAGEVPPEVERFVSNAHRAARGLLHLVNDVLDLSKIEAGKVDLHVERMGAAELLRDAVASVAPIADQKGLRMIVDPIGELPPLMTDVDRVRQILINLLSNAVKFTDEGEVRLGIELATRGRGRRPGDRLIRIHVRDTGPGIPEEDQERIFHEFEQIRSGTSQIGTGLGLPISRKLARLLGGELAVESELGAGATFILTLPVEPPPERGTAIATPAGQTAVHR